MQAEIQSRETGGGWLTVCSSEACCGAMVARRGMGEEWPPYSLGDSTAVHQAEGVYGYFLRNEEAIPSSFLHFTHERCVNGRSPDSTLTGLIKGPA